MVRRTLPLVGRIRGGDAPRSPDPAPGTVNFAHCCNESSVPRIPGPSREFPIPFWATTPQALTHNLWMLARLRRVKKKVQANPLPVRQAA
jgi:hypothetical protein